MPKLSEKAVERKKGRIEDAAKQLFIRQGFHATSMRKIAARAGTSLGNLYNYYPTKEAILGSIISKYQRVIDDRLRSMFDEIKDPLSPDGLKRFGKTTAKLLRQVFKHLAKVLILKLQYIYVHQQPKLVMLVDHLLDQPRKPFEIVPTQWVLDLVKH